MRFDGYSWYHSLQTGIEKSFSKGCTIQMNNNLRALPKAILGVWQFSGVYTYQTGATVSWGNIIFRGKSHNIAFVLYRLHEGQSQPLGLRVISPLQIRTAPHQRAVACAPLTIDRNFWRLDLDSPVWSRIATSIAQDSNPRLWPDGKQLLFRSDRSDTECLYLAASDASNPQAIVPNARASVAVGSPTTKTWSSTTRSTSTSVLTTSPPGNSPRPGSSAFTPSTPRTPRASSLAATASSNAGL